MRSEPNNITRLTIDLPSSMHRLIKAQASLQNMSIKDFVVRAIENDVDNTPIKTRELNATTIRALRYSIKNPHKGKSPNSLDDMMKDLMSAPKKKKITTGKKPIRLTQDEYTKSASRSRTTSLSSPRR